MNVEVEVPRLVSRIVAWLRDYGPDYALVLHKTGAAEADLAALERGLERPLPPALKAMLSTTNGDFYVGEYLSLSTQGIADTWGSCRRLFDDGTFAQFEAHHDSGGILKPGWWHPGLIPVLEDSGGNQLCIDLDPGPRGIRGQMVWWEVHEGPIPHGADSLLTLLRAHWRHLSSGKYNSPGAWESAGCWELTRV